MSKKELICFLKGHADDETDESIPYGFCPRCEKDYNDWIKTLRWWWQRIRYEIIWWWRKNIYWRCDVCKKAKIILGKEKNNHSD